MLSNDYECKDVCQRTDFEEIEIITGTCKWEGACFFTVGGCPLVRLSNAMYDALDTCEFCHCNPDCNVNVPSCLDKMERCNPLDCEYIKDHIK